MIDVSFITLGQGKTYNVKTNLIFNGENRNSITIIIKRIDEVKKTGLSSYEMVKNVYDSSFASSMVDDKILKTIAEKIGQKYRTKNITISK